MLNLNRRSGCGNAESASNLTESTLVPESDSGSMNPDRGTAHRSPFPATMVRAGPVPDRAVLWTGRRRSGPDRTEQGHGPVSRDRTGRDEARAGPSGSVGPARVQARARAGAWRRGEGAGGSGARRGDVRQLWKFQREIEEPRRSPERAHRRRIWHDGRWTEMKKTMPDAAMQDLPRRVRWCIR